ncbi:MAG: hypothetical protein AWM53_01527 [Candidatus Dichloromethanomonas elyunquensis]|nr:MAG: hypothetical protein AWM53_01527 [Candidatus Dichloromethanomonas elyunquensis]
MYKPSLKLSQPDERDYHVSGFIKVESKFERKYDLPKFPIIPVVDQEEVCDCYACAMRVEREYVEMIQTGIYVALSQGSVYGNRVQGDDMSPGLIPRVTNQRVMDRGICTSAIYPENIEVPKAIELYNRRIVEIEIDGKKRRFTAYALARNNDEIKSCLKMGFPVLIGMPVYEDFYNVNVQSPIVTMPKGKYEGDHGMVLWGWDDDMGSGSWHDRNSWGEKWGDKGNCWIPYDYPIREAWLIVDDLIPKVESTKYERDIKKIVVHHMGDEKGTDVSIVSRWNPYGYEYPEYDWGIEGDGKVIQGRPLSVIGSHAIATYQDYTTGEYYDKENNWWNKNSIGIGLAGDFTMYSMPKEMFDSLVSLTKKLMAQYGLTVNDVLPHREITATQCPGDNMGWSWDKFIEKISEGEEEMIDNIVIYADGDTGTALILSQKLGCPMIHKASSDKYKATNKHWIGVQGTDGNGNFYYAGADRTDTAKKVLL